MGPDAGPTAAQVTERLARVRERIAAAGGDPSAVTVVAVTKGFGPGAVEAATAAGLADVGESYAQELVAKADALGWGAGAARPRVHFIGRLQRNKVRQVAGTVDCWQSIDRLALGEEVARRAPGSRVLVQVDAVGEPQKGGCPPGAAAALHRELAALGLDVVGVMGMGKAGDARATRAAFRLLVDLADRLGLPVRSLGMSGDLEAAVDAGSTMVRVGHGLFGARPR